MKTLTIEITMPLLRETLRKVQEQLLSREINGKDKKLKMNFITQPSSCGMAACIGGWTSLFLLGFDTTRDNKLEDSVDDLFRELMRFDTEHGTGRLYELFYDYSCTTNYDEPNVAATAIERYLANVRPWSEGEMPDVMPYKEQ